jgi:amidase
MARTVSDAAILLGAMTGVDPRDPMTQESDGKSHTDYTLFLDANGMQGARIGVARNFFGFDDRVDRIINGCIEEMKRLGAEIIDPVRLKTAQTTKRLEKMRSRVFRYEFKTGLTKYLAELGENAKVRSLKEIIDFNNQNKGKVMPYFGQEIFLRAEKDRPLKDEYYKAVVQESRHFAGRDGIDAVMRQYQLDTIVAPASGPPGLNDFISNAYRRMSGSSEPAAMAGYPHITIPAGYMYGLPVGISFFAGAFQEPKLLKLAFAFEQATRMRRPPQFLPTANLES